MDSAEAKAFTASLQGKIVGGWEISGFYGNGKSAVVLPAVKGGVPGAIKVFHPELIDRFGRAMQIERVERERALIGQYHPHLVRILDGGECPDTKFLYVTMERLSSSNLRERLADIPIDSIPKILAQVSSAARFLEDLGLVHRDIKPENIAISADLSTATLLDLGVVKPLLGENVTDVDARRFIGTLRYSSPEFLLRKEEPTTEGGRAITFYQLGAVLHDMLMQRPIFEDHSDPYPELVQAVLHIKPEIFSADARSVALAKRCLVKSPTARLELVQWRDFLDLPEETSGNLALLQKTLKQRQAYFRADSPVSSLEAIEKERLMKVRLEDVANRFAARVDALLVASDLYPLKTMKSQRSLVDRTCTTLIKFEVDTELGLPAHLAMRCLIKLVDENSGDAMYTASSCWALIGQNVQREVLEQLGPLQEFYSGGIDALLDSTELETQFARALEAAYITTDKGLEITPELIKVLQEEGV